MTSNQITQIIVLILLLLHVGTIAALIVLLKKKMAVTLYSYVNAGLLGGIIFLTFSLICSIINIIKATGSNIPDWDYGLALLGTWTTIGQKFLLILLPLLFILFMAVSISNIQLMKHEGRTPRNMLGAFLGLFFIIAAVAVTFGWDLIYQYVIFPIYLTGKNWIRIIDTGVPLFFSGLISYLICILFGVIISQFWVLRYKPSYDQDFVIILGCAIAPDGTPYPLLRSRIDRAIRFAKAQELAGGKPLCFVPSGGQGTDECMSEARCMKNYLLSQGVDASRIIMEDQSTTTLENMMFSKKVIEARKKDAKVLFSTNNYHVFRSGIFAAQAGLKADGIGAKTKNYFWPNAFIREFIALLFTRKKSHLIVSGLILVFSFVLAVLARIYIT